MSGERQWVVERERGGGRNLMKERRYQLQKAGRRRQRNERGKRRKDTLEGGKVEGEAKGREGKKERKGGCRKLV